MFNKTEVEQGISLAFLQSSLVKAFPSGRRRSTVSDTTYYIPFDPEARLNTEANARKHSGLNGYTQTYLKDWDKDNKLLTISLAGYLFNISLTDDYITEITTGDTTKYSFNATKFGEDVVNLVRDTSATSVYANIILEDEHLYSSGIGGAKRETYTSVLRDQLGAINSQPSTCLDLPIDEDADFNDLVDPAKYYFSGLSFSVEPLAELSEKNDQTLSYGVQLNRDSREVNGNNVDFVQQIVSLHILEKVEGVWEIYQPALLPFIEHDIDEDSVKMGETHVRKNLTVDENATVTNNFTVTDRVEVTTDTTKVKNKLVVENDVEVLNNKITTKDLTSTDTILANNIGTSTSKVTKITAKDADIELLNADDIQQKVSGLADISEGPYDVPVVFLKKVDDDYQLQITRVNNLN